MYAALFGEPGQGGQVVVEGGAALGGEGQPGARALPDVSFADAWRRTGAVGEFMKSASWWNMASDSERRSDHMSVTDALLANARRYPDHFATGELSAAPERHLTVVACMD